MDTKRFIICGDAKRSLSSAEEANALHLHLYGPEDEHKIWLEINDIRKSMCKEVPDRFRDLLDIATYVYAADQASRRGAKELETFGQSWRRPFHFVIPVRDLDFWQSNEVCQCLSTTLAFLSDDHYHFEFVPIHQVEPLQRMMNFNEDGEMLGYPEQVVMFSGGLDSLGGAVEEIVNQKRRIVLVNHKSTHKLDRRFEKLQSLLDGKASHNQPELIRININKKKWMNREYTQRSRSFLFVSLGATIAKMLGKTNVRFYENGVLSLNLPICAQVVGGKATRTTHPQVIHGFKLLLSQVADEPFQVENPFIWKTKGEVVELIARADCADLITDSISCTHTWDITNDQTHCGYCSQCIDRRFAVIAAKMENYDPLQQYKMDIFTESRTKNEQVHEDKTMFASYLERANQVDQVKGPLQFLTRYPEVARALNFLDADPGCSLQRCYDMFKRHAAEVNSVVEKMLSMHQKAIRQRTIPPDAMLRIVYESNLPIATPAIPIQQEAMPKNIFRRRGMAWQVRFQGHKDFTVLPCKGADYLHYLLEASGQSISTIEVVCGSAAEYCNFLMDAKAAIDQGLQCSTNPLLETLGDISDWDAVKEYREEVQELLAAIERAREENNVALVCQIEKQIVEITAKIHEAVGIRGRLKQAKDQRKNIRDSFRSCVDRVIKEIQKTDAALAQHLKVSIRFGNSAIYQPEQNVSWEVQPIVND